APLESEIHAFRKAYETKLSTSNFYLKGQIRTLTIRLNEKPSTVSVTHTSKSKTYIQQPGTAIAVLDTGAFESPTETLRKFRSFLDERIIEQPEVKDALYDLEFETLIKGRGNSSEPAFFYLMGLPGVGKDTSAE